MGRKVPYKHVYNRRQKKTIDQERRTASVQLTRAVLVENVCGARNCWVTLLMSQQPMGFVLRGPGGGPRPHRAVSLDITWHRSKSPLEAGWCHMDNGLLWRGQAPPLLPRDRCPKRIKKTIKKGLRNHQLYKSSRHRNYTICSFMFVFFPIRMQLKIIFIIIQPSGYFLNSQSSSAALINPNRSHLCYSAALAERNETFKRSRTLTK